MRIDIQYPYRVFYMETEREPNCLESIILYRITIPETFQEYKVISKIDLGGYSEGSDDRGWGYISEKILVDRMGQHYFVWLEKRYEWKRIGDFKRGYRWIVITLVEPATPEDVRKFVEASNPVEASLAEYLEREARKMFS